MKITTLLFYLLLLLLPTQLGRHFFFDFSLISGIRSDYLAPTIYLTDIIILGMLLSSLVEWIGLQQINSKHEARSSKQYKKTNVQNSKKKMFRSFGINILNLFRNSDFGFRICLLVIGYLFFNSLLIATNKWVAFYKLAKLIEFVLLGFIIVRLRPKIATVILFLSIGVIYSSVIALWQFTAQNSIGGLLWWLGERTFYASTPGIANFSLDGRIILRPYGTFPHPNVLGGYLALTLPLLLSEILQKGNPKFLKIWYYLSFVIGAVALFFTYSRAAWIVATLGLFLVIVNASKFITSRTLKKGVVPLLLFYCLLIISVSLPLVVTRLTNLAQTSWIERANLIRASLNLVSKNIFLGVGLNNFIVHLHTNLPSSVQAYIFQPVHNIYLLILVETGLIGFTLFIFTLLVIFHRSLTTSIITLSLISLYILGVFDHYLVTLQQGQLLFTLFASLALIPRRV